MKFKLKNIRKRSNTKKRKYTSRKNKKYVIESSRKYKRVAKRYYKNNTHKRNKIQNGGLKKKDIDEVLFLSNCNELLALQRSFILKYSKILSNGRPTLDSSFTKPSNFTVYFFKNDPPPPLQLDPYPSLVSSTSVYKHYFTLKMVRHNPAKLFTVGFRAIAPLEIKYISGVAMAREYTQQQIVKNLAVANATDYDNATELVFDTNNKITNLTITDDTGKDTYIFKEDDNKEFFRILSNITFCLN